MALKKTVITAHGIEAHNAYHRVESLSLETKYKIQFRVRSSVDGVLPHFADLALECEYRIDGDNPIKQAYEHLKTLPEFADATDC
jgi:hypothetical protein